MTTDHSIVQLLLDAGEILPDEIDDHPARAQLTRFVGMGSEPLPEVHCFELHTGDRLLLCTDGLWGQVSATDITKVLRSNQNPEDVIHGLVDTANEAGGRDNATAVVIEVSDLNEIK